LPRYSGDNSNDTTTAQSGDSNTELGIVSLRFQSAAATLNCSVAQRRPQQVRITVPRVVVHGSAGMMRPHGMTATATALLPHPGQYILFCNTTVFSSGCNFRDRFLTVDFDLYPTSFHIYAHLALL
jgi:hypothetical protein